jgi:streptogramin lyase
VEHAGERLRSCCLGGQVPTNGTVIEHDVEGMTPVGITSGPDSAIWFTSLFTDEIGRLAMDGAISKYLVPTTNSGPYHIVAGPNGALWFTEIDGNKIGRLAIPLAEPASARASQQSQSGAQVQAGLPSTGTTGRPLAAVGAIALICLVCGALAQFTSRDRN